MDIYGKRGNGEVFVQNNPRKLALPKKVTESYHYEGAVKVLEQFNNKSEVNESDYTGELAPDRPFSETMNAIHGDGRLDLSNETYDQMIIGKGLRVVIKNKKANDDVNDWLDDTGFHEKLEDGLPSYTGAGNWIVEKDPTGSEFVEIPITTMKSITRKANGHIKRYVQYVNNKTILYKPTEVVHFKLTNVAREPFARGLFHSIINDYTDPRTGEVYDSPLIQMKQMEHNMSEIFKGHANPTVMFHFADAGEQFIKEQADNLKKMKSGSKIVTDKEFEAKVIEPSNGGKFDSYVEHLQRDVLEPGSKFPLQFFNAGFTARAASESTDSVLIRKVKKIQVRLANQIKMLWIMPYIKKHFPKIKSKDVQVFFETPTKHDVAVTDVITGFRDNIIRRSEARKWFIENSTLGKFIDQNDMEDEAPITSVTPTGQMREPAPSGRFGGNVDGKDVKDGDKVTAKPIPQRKE